MKLLIKTLWLFCLILTLTTIADDTEIFYRKPNVLFLISSANTMLDPITKLDGSQSTKFEILKESLKKLAASETRINMGLMRYSNIGGSVAYPVTNLELSEKHRSELIAVIDDFKTIEEQSIIETFLEAYYYYHGDTVDFGASRGSPADIINRVSHKDSHNGVITYGDNSVFGSGVGDAETCLINNEEHVCLSETVKVLGTAKYTPPTNIKCQPNHIIILTDDEPTALQSSSIKKFNDITGNACLASDQGKKCSLDLALYMSTFGINNEDKFFSDTDERYIHTWPIYFGHVSDDEISFLDLLAKYGGSELNNAIVVENETDLKVAFEEIISSLIEVNTSFVSSGISVSQFNRVVHSDQIYFSLFSPESYAQWSGNVKRYRIHDNTIFDSNNNPAVDKTTDSFYKTAKSFWSTMVDGNDVDLGGVVEQLDFSMISRLVFSNITADQKGYFSASNNNLVTKENAKKSPIIWNSLLDVSSENEREDVLTWVEGLPINSDNYHNILGDPLHSKPMLLRYRDIDGAEFERLFVGTNHGFLHAFDTQNGQEQWAFIPKELLDGIKNHIEIFKPSPEKHRYGIDGTISIYVEDKNKDGYVDINSNPALTDHALLFVGMRRGGQSYYAFDITNDKEPKLLYVIDNTVSGYRNLGQSWSKPTVIKIADSSQISGYQLGLVFGGGYDINQDPSVDEPTGGAPNNNDTVGNNIFIADALTGRLIWDAQTDAVNKQAAKAGSITDMNSIPANVAVIDFEKPGYLTHLYAADTLGQVFRFDFNRNWDGNNAQSTLAQGGKLAEIQTKADGAGCKEIICNRRFYYSPDVTLVKRPNNLSFMAVSIGSGYRAHPLGLENADHFYSIRDMGVLQSEVSAESKLTGFRLFTNHDGEINNNDEVIRIENLVSIRSQLQDFSSDFTDSQEDYRLEPALELVENLNNPKAGWFLELDIGEKVLAKSLTFANKVMFTTYLPPSALDDCSLSYGSGRLYSVNIIDGTPVTDVFNRAHIHNDRYLDLHQTGIPPEPQILLMPDPMLIVGRETTNIFQKFIVSDYGEMSRIQWREIIN